MQGSEAAIESIIANLLNNSLASFERSRSPAKQRVIEIETTVEDGNITCIVSDNGPGIHGLAVDSIWLPGQTTRSGGTGLGLTIVRDTVADLGGSVRAESQGKLGGADFIFSFPLLGV
jgi:C4-dicarboxylate-specific signal transduction histidine kinase